MQGFRLQEVVRQNGGHIEHVLHYEQFSSLWGLIPYQVSIFVIIKMCYVHNQWYGISCATLYLIIKSQKSEIEHQESEKSIKKWQQQWDDTTKGLVTKEFFPYINP